MKLHASAVQAQIPPITKSIHRKITVYRIGCENKPDKTDSPRRSDYGEVQTAAQDSEVIPKSRAGSEPTEE